MVTGYVLRLGCPIGRRFLAMWKTVNGMITIAKKQNCTGCYACSSVCSVSAITMEVDNEGFWYPVVDYTKCTRCGVCTTACPVIKTATQESSDQSEPKAYAAYCTDEYVRLQSSSGGLFTLLAETVINNGGVVFGARFDEGFNVIHGYVESTEHLYRLRGSKYVQSRIGNTFKQVREFLERGKPVMFTGTPCQVSGLKRYLGREYSHLICQDIICHGVPSPKVWAHYVSYRESCAGSATRRIAFRQKGEGWKRFSVSFLFENHTEYVRSLDKDLYMKAFLKNICLRPSCYACNFKSVYRESDITLADFWGIQYLIPSMDDDKGTSFVVTHTQRGYELFNSLQGRIEVAPVSLNEGIRYNSSMVTSVAPHPDRERFFERLDDVRIDELIRKCCRDKPHVRLKRELMSRSRPMLERLGLLDKARSILSRR